MSFKFESFYLDEPFIRERGIDVFIPENISQEISLVFVHGGGWQSGTRSDPHKLMEAFCNEGFICASFGYRLFDYKNRMSGITAFDQLTDLRHAYDCFISFLKAHKRPLKIFTHGGSAGAHLSALMALAAPGQCGEKLEYNGKKLCNDWVRPVASSFQAIPVLYEPWEDILPEAWNTMQLVAGTLWERHSETYKKLAPVEYISNESQPLFFINAANEQMFPLEYVETAAEKLRSFGQKCLVKTYTNAEHGFFYDLVRRQQREAFKDILDFISNLK